MNIPLDDFLDFLAELELQAAEEEMQYEEVLSTVRTYVINYD